MTTVLTPPPTRTRFKTLSDLQQRLGGVPEARIRLDPAPGYATMQDLLDIDAKEDRLCELVDGVLVEKPMGWTESLLAVALGSYLRQFIRPRHLGVVVGADGPVELRPDLVRLPDVAYVAWARLPHGLPTEPIPAIAPNLAVEVLSPTNTRNEMRIKRGEYFQAGTELVWEVDPVQRTVAVYTAVDNPTILTDTDTLDGGSVLPGFQLSLTEFFGELDEEP